MKNKNVRTTLMPKHRNKKPYILAAGGLVLVAAVIAGLELANLTYIFHDKPQPTTASSETKGEPQTPGGGKDSTGSPPPATPDGEPPKDPGNDQPATALLTPSGDFVSNHRPNLSGNPAPNEISSVCTTTPGASCKITFTKDGVTKTLPAQTTDKGGSAYWNWKLQDIGLTAGTWNIKAIATVNNQTKEAADAIDLEVAE